jgi:hypothetical protein
LVIIRISLAVGSWLIASLLAFPSLAAQVDNLYGATVELSGSDTKALNNGFDRALGQVLVKVTGLPDAGNRSFRQSRFPAASSLVQRYSKLPKNRLEAYFDAGAIRNVLDSAGLPIWGEQRPQVVVWLGIDSGGGRREIIAAAPISRISQLDAVDNVRKRLLEGADQRGLPMVLPLVDAQDLSIVTFADIWGAFREPLIDVSQRYGADVVLIGRSDSLSTVNDRVRWTMLWGSEEQSWTGTIASGPTRAAELLAQRLATFANSAGAQQVLVQNVATLEDYGRLKKYFESMNIVERATVARAAGSEVEFALVVRGDLARLEYALDTGSFLEPVGDQPDALDVGRMPDLIYTLPVSR